MSIIEVHCDYDENTLAEKYIHMKHGDVSTDNDKPHRFAVIDAENIIRFIRQGVDRSTSMINYARSNCIPHTSETYFVLDVVTDDLLTILDRKFSIVIQAHMLFHAEKLQELTQIISNIDRVCSEIFVGIIPNPECDLTSAAVRKLKKYGIINKQSDCDEEPNTPMSVGGTTYRPKNELTLIDHWHSPETYEKIF